MIQFQFPIFRLQILEIEICFKPVIVRGKKVKKESCERKKEEKLHLPCLLPSALPCTNTQHGEVPLKAWKYKSTERDRTSLSSLAPSKVSPDTFNEKSSQWGLETQWKLRTIHWVFSASHQIFSTIHQVFSFSASANENQLTSADAKKDQELFSPIY